MRINIELCCFVGESGFGNNTSLPNVLPKLIHVICGKAWAKYRLADFKP